jgi:hypothetical protein
LQKSLKLTLIALTAIVVASCAGHKVEKKEITEIDSLVISLQSVEKLMSEIDSIEIDLLAKKIASFLDKPALKDNIAALESLETAAGFVKIFPEERANMIAKFSESYRQLDNLREDILNDKHSPADIQKYLLSEKKAAEEIRTRVDYLYSRFNAQALLVETLEKAYPDE